MRRTDDDELLLGEWACLGILYAAPSHGFAIASRLKPSGDIGRVWSLTRPLTYRSLDQLEARGYVHAIGEEPGIAGGNRTIFTATRTGRHRLRAWLRTPVAHLRDVRSELLLKLVIAEMCQVDVTAMLVEQRDQIAEMLEAQSEHGTAGTDVVSLWRAETAHAALRFVKRLIADSAR